MTELRKSDLHTSVSDPLLDTMNFLNEITDRYPDAISFAPGRPYAGFFETEHIFGYLERYLKHLRDQGRSPAAVRDAVFQYGPTGGQIREVIADWLNKDENIRVSPEAIVVTVGCQEAMLLTLRALVSGPDDLFLVSSPCYVGITGAAALLDIEVAPVHERDDGLHCADLATAVRAGRIARRRARVFYTVPDHANPSGNTMPLAVRHELLELADTLDLIILEDSPYRLVSPGRQLPSLKSLDRHGRVVHLGSLSKTLLPGARVGFAIADQLVRDESGATSLLADELCKIKSMVTVNTSPLSQAVVAGMLLAHGGTVAELNHEMTRYYGEAMSSTLRCLDRQFPAARRGTLGVRWNRPSGGFFLNMTVPFVADNDALARCAGTHQVLWTPMSYFYPLGGGDHGIRLSISALEPDDISTGIGRLAAFIESEVIAAGTHQPGRGNSAGRPPQPASLR
jgi:(S)-3,5-dihydroxyphenylglycine transaminase